MKAIQIKYEKIQWPDENIYIGSIAIPGQNLISFQMNEYNIFNPFQVKYDFSPPTPNEGLQRAIKKYILQKEDQHKEQL